jgi:hypothetical protein
MKRSSVPSLLSGLLARHDAENLFATAAAFVQRANSNQLIIQVCPPRIELLNQSQLLPPAAGLDLLLACDRLDHASMQFVPDQNFAAVFFRETRNLSFPVFERMSRQIAGHAGIERPVSRTCHDADAGPFHAVSHWLCALSPSLRGALATTASAEARGAKAETIQFFLRGTGLLRYARNDGERATETSPCHCEGTCDEAIQLFLLGPLDCLASLTMTWRVCETLTHPPTRPARSAAWFRGRRSSAVPRSRRQRFAGDRSPGARP